MWGGEGFVHMLNMLARHLHQLISVTDQDPHGADICFRSEG
jgi:hypothetical protein